MATPPSEPSRQAAYGLCYLLSSKSVWPATEFLYNQLVRLLQPAASPHVVVDMRKKRFANGVACPRCGSTHVHRLGKYKNDIHYPAAAAGPAIGIRRPKMYPSSLSDRFTPLCQKRCPRVAIGFLKLMPNCHSLRTAADAGDRTALENVSSMPKGSVTTSVSGPP